MPFFRENKNNLELQFEKPNVNFLVDENSEVIRIYKIIKQLDFSEFYKRYSEKGAVAYRPEILFALIILSAVEGNLSSRSIERKCTRDVYYIYLTEYRKPDHSTIARFLKKFKKEIQGLLPQLIKYAIENKISTFSTIALDGSKFQSSSSRKHSMKMSNLKEEEKQIARKIIKLMNQIRENDKIESRDEKKQNKIQYEIKRLEQKKQKVEKSIEDLSERQKELRHEEEKEKHQINIEEPDARMMKELNSNGYNIQLAVDTQSEMIVGVNVETDRSDNHQFSKQHQNSESILGENKQREYLADGGYTSTETLDYVEENEVEAYINDNRGIGIIPSVDKLVKRNKYLNNEFFVYNRKEDVYQCPADRKLKKRRDNLYESENCEGCLLASLCLKGAKRRKLTRTEYAERIESMRKKIKENPEKMNKRKAVERVFGKIKWNLKIRRFTRKGLEGAAVEIIMYVLALNFRKVVELFFGFFIISNKRFLQAA
jgi:transposase